MKFMIVISKLMDEPEVIKVLLRSKKDYIENCDDEFWDPKELME